MYAPVVVPAQISQRWFLWDLQGRRIAVVKLVHVGSVHMHRSTAHLKGSSLSTFDVSLSFKISIVRHMGQVMIIFVI